MISIDVSLGTEEILPHYTQRWNIELFFRESKNKLAFDKYQVRSAQEIKRYWLLMSLTYFVCSSCTGKRGIAALQRAINIFVIVMNEERLRYIYKCAQRGVFFEEIWSLVA